MSAIMLRSGRPDDAAVLLDMFDGAVAWLVERGRAGQWGSTPFSKNPKRVARVRAMAAHPGLVIAEIDGVAAGAAIFADHPPAHIPPVDEPEVYIDLLITAREFTGRGVGAFLLTEARAEARRRGRVWCGWTVGQAVTERSCATTQSRVHATVTFEVAGPARCSRTDCPTVTVADR